MTEECCTVNNKENHFDLLVLGGGSGAFAAAISAAELGKSVAVIEHRKKIGGTCLNRGCVPSKHLLRAGEVYFQATHQPFKGFKLSQESLDFAKIITEKDKMVDYFRDEKYWNVLEAYPQIRLFNSFGSFVDSHTIKAGEESISFENAIIATGGEPFLPPFDGVNDIDWIDSSAALNLKKLPKSLIVIGGRAVGLELGQMFHHFGVKVTILQRSEHILPNLDAEVSAEIEKCLRDEGIEVLTSTSIQKFKKEGSNSVVVFEHEGKEKTLAAEKILFGTGKKPNTSKIGLENTKITTSKKGNIEVTEEMKTAESHIYAVGDVVGKMELVTVSAAEAHTAIENMYQGGHKKVDYSVIPHAVFTSPNVAVAGLTEKEAQKQGIKTISRVLPYSKIPKAGAVLDTRGLIKMVAEEGSEKILGVQIVGENAADTIQTAVFALLNGMTVKSVADAVFVYPTHTESIKMVAQTFHKDVSKLSCCA
jgi:mercuric reductase